MPYQDLMKGCTGPSRLPSGGSGWTSEPAHRGLDEAKASLLASAAIEQLRVSGYVLGHREHPVTDWVNGGSDITVAPRQARPQPPTDWMLPTSAKRE